jgi:hypothetical protein
LTALAQVLVIDRNGYYGGEAASLNLTVRGPTQGADIDATPAMLPHMCIFSIAHYLPFALQELYKKFMAKSPEEEPPKAFMDALGENRCAVVTVVAACF